MSSSRAVAPAIVVVDTTWLFKNFKKDLVEMSTVKILSGSGRSSSGSSSATVYHRVSSVSRNNSTDRRQTCWMLAVCPLRFDIHALRPDGDLQPLVIVRLKSHNIGHVVEPFHDRSQLLQWRKEDKELQTRHKKQGRHFNAGTKLKDGAYTSALGQSGSFIFSTSVGFITSILTS